MKASPLRRFTMTFFALLAGAAPAWAAINLATDFQTGATKIGLGVLAALLGGGLAALLALTKMAPATPLGKALATFGQGIAAGLGTFTFAVLTFAEFERFGMVALTIAGQSFTAALITFFTNAAPQEKVSA